MRATITGVGSGGKPVVNITFPFIDKAHVKATAGGLAAGLSWTNTSQVTFTANVGSGSEWKVYRETPTSAAIVDFTDASLITEADLDLSNTAHRYRDDELADLIEQGALDNAQALVDAENASQAFQGRTVRAPGGELLSVLASAASRAGKLLGFSSSGDVSLTALSAVDYSSNQAKIADSRTVLSAYTGMAAGQAAILTEEGRGGTFKWSTANHSADVTADPRQAIYVAPNFAPTGASGAWVREFSGKVNVQWFGAVADWNGTSGTDNGAAFTAALAFLNATSFPGPYDNGNRGLYIPKGRYWLNTTTLDIHTTIIMEGEGVGEAGGNATQLKWAAGATGIRVHDPRTTGDSGSHAQDNTQGGAASIIRNMQLEGGFTGSNDSDFHGIQLRARASLRDLGIYNFQGNGIHIAADTMGNGGIPLGNANNFEVYKVIVMGCRNGLYTVGGDVNAGVVTALDAMSHRQWGVSENGFLGNTYVACHTSGNASGPYQTTNLNNRSVFIGCYSEGDQPPSSFAQDTVVLGGLHGAGVNAAARFISADSNGLNIYNGFGVGSFSAGQLAILSANTSQGFYRIADVPGGFGFQVGNLGTYPLFFDTDSRAHAPGGLTTANIELALDVQILTGFGAPEGVVSASLGSIFILVGGTTATLYVKESGGGGNTGWVAK